jgi:hypothetical protein
LEIFHSDVDGAEIFSSEKIQVPYGILIRTIRVADEWLNPK